MKKCDHIDSLNVQDLSELSKKFLSKQCSSCPKKTDLYISLQDFRIMCSSHTNLSCLQLRKETFQIHCKKCERIVPIEKSPLKNLISRLPESMKLNRVLGCTGLANLGNTCYINVIIQVLSNTYCIKKYFLGYVSKIRTQGILKEFCNVLSSLRRGDPYCEPRNFIVYADGEFSHNLNRRRHQDTSEFFNFFHSAIDSNLKSQIGSNFMTDAFTWKMCSSYSCLKCNNSTNVIEEFIDLPLCIPTKKVLKELKPKSQKLLSDRDRSELEGMTNSMWKKIKLAFRSNTYEAFSLYDCLASYFSTEVMNDPQNLRCCEKCNSGQVCSKTPKIDYLSPVLVISLKRYHTATSKYPIHIQLPLELNLNAFSTNNSLQIYQLTGVISHKGDLDNGHYVAYCKNFKENQWFKFDDSKVSVRTASQVLSRQAYIAFYSEIPIKNKVSAGDAFVPLEWVGRLKSVNNPGMILYSKYLCEHGKLALSRNENDFSKVSPDNISQYSEREPLLSLELCDICKNIKNEKSKIANREQDLAESMCEDEKNYAINRQWLETWVSYLKTYENPPKSINNAVLFNENLTSSQRNHNTPHLITHKLWSILVYLYGADFEAVYESKQLVKKQPSPYEFTSEFLDSLNDLKKSKLIYYP